MAITVHVPAYASLHRLADAVKGGELSYMAPGSDGTRAKLTAYSSLMELVDPESMLARLIHCSILRDGLHSSYAHLTKKHRLRISSRYLLVLIIIALRVWTNIPVRADASMVNSQWFIVDMDLREARTTLPSYGTRMGLTNCSMYTK